MDAVVAPIIFVGTFFPPFPSSRLTKSIDFFIWRNIKIMVQMTAHDRHYPLVSEKIKINFEAFRFGKEGKWKTVT